MNILKKIIAETKHNGIYELAKSAIDNELPPSWRLSDILNLAWYFYLIEDKETAFQLTDLINDMESPDDEAICRHLDKSLALRSALYKEQGMLEESKKCIDQIGDRLDKITQSVPCIKIRLLNGHFLDYARLTNSKDIFNAYDVYNEYDERLAHLKQLMWIHELGGGKEFSVERADREIKENIARLKTLIQNGEPSI